MAFALFLPFFSLDLEAMRSLFQQFVAAASPLSTIFDHAATIPSEFARVFSFRKVILPT
jgi:hypothetical protein